MLYKNLTDQIDFAEGLIEYAHNPVHVAENRFKAIVYLIYIEDIFDGNRDLFEDQVGFDLDDEEKGTTRNAITKSMDRIRNAIPELIDEYGRDQFTFEYKNKNLTSAQYWVK